MILYKKFKDGLWTISFDVHGRIEEAVGKTVAAAVDVMHAVINTTRPTIGSVWITSRGVKYKVARVENINACYVICENGVSTALVDWHYEMHIT